VSPRDANTASAEVPVLEVRGLTKDFSVRDPTLGLARRKTLRAVEDVSFGLTLGSVMAIVGESGCGKSTVARLLAQLQKPTAGEIALDGARIEGLSGRALRAYRRQVQIIFQDPFASLNPVHTVGYHLMRPLRIHHLAESHKEMRDKTLGLLEKVNLTPSSQFFDKYPYELSGGQRQRVAIARALAVSPRVLLADEPVSMLDVSIRLSVLSLLADLVRIEKLALLYITHDIASARYSADNLLVMYAGRLVEGGSAEAVTQSPAHPYTKLLISASPNPDARDRPPIRAPGEAPRLIELPSGCRFHPRCAQAGAICAEKEPTPSADLGGGHWAACWFLNGEAPPGLEQRDKALGPGLATNPSPGAEEGDAQED
jgi:peptide/nickel transport system ATP-binding protein